MQERGEGVLAAELRSAAAACSGTSCSIPPVPGGYTRKSKDKLAIDGSRVDAVVMGSWWYGHL